MISLARSLKEFSRDIHQRPETVSRALARSVPPMVKTAVFMSRISGIPRSLIGFHREAFLSPRQFRELALPEISGIVSGLSRSKVVTVLHCDSDWTPHLEALRELPEKKCVLEFDGATDIFKAKKVLGKSQCLKGDVPGRILSLGTREQVLDYCRKLIEEVGEGGGFILASGCEIPPDAKPENVAAMREAVEKYGKY
jgi:uroporphyrinogen-III decarboxylase